MTEAHAAPVPILDAACVVVIDGKEPEYRLLLGRRHAGQIFLPGKWVFPGGRIDPEDRSRAAKIAATAAPAMQGALGPFAIAAVRELFEETGLVIGGAGNLHASQRLVPLARAITPPGRPRRYDTWFFTIQRSAIAAEYSDTDGELLDLGWFTIAEARRLDLPNITRLILDDVANETGLLNTAMTGRVPFYFQDSTGYQRSLIDPGCDLACDGP